MRGALLFALLVAAPASAEVRWGERGDPVADRIERGSRLWLASVCTPQPELEDYFSVAFVGTGIDGRRYGRAGPIEGSGGARDCVFQAMRVQIFDDRVAVAYGNEAAAFPDGSGAYVRRCLAWTDTWMNEDGVWRIIAAQDNFVACPESQQ